MFDPVAEDRQGHIWILTDLGVNHWDGSRLCPVSPTLGKPMNLGMLEDREGALGLAQVRTFRLLDRQIVRYSEAMVSWIEITASPWTEGTVWRNKRRLGPIYIRTICFVPAQRWPH